MSNLFNNNSLLVVFALICSNISISSARNTKKSGCTIKIPNDIPKENEPIYLQTTNGRHYKIFKPENETNIFRKNSVLTLACVGKDNVLIKSKQNLTNLICNNRNEWTDDSGKFVNITTLNCTKLIKAELKSTSVRCARNHGHIYDVGYDINRNNFLSVFQICYNNVTDKTFFAKHQINGKAIKYAVKDSSRIPFRATGIGNSASINQLYTKKNQIERFKIYFGSTQDYVNNTMFLARGHLTPDADFIFSSQQLSTYFYANVGPEFQKINAGNWVRIENLARDLANAFSADFDIYTGYYDSLQLPNKSGKLISIYLDAQNNYEVPKWFFKVIKNVETNAGIVIITLNNPFAKLNEIHEFCPNVCQEASLNSKYFADISRGYTFCCKVNEFKNVVYDLPQNLTAKYLLNCAHANNAIF